MGADIALNHGALVGLDGRVLYYFEDGLGMMSTFDDLYDRARELVRATPPKSTVVVDFDRKQGSWSSRGPEVALLIAMSVAFYGALAQSVRSCDVHYVTPSLVRYCLGLPDLAHKQAVHEHVAASYQVPVFGPDRHGDKMDAWVLALTYQCAREQFSL